MRWRKQQRLARADGAGEMAERFSERLRKKAGGIWEAQHAHPFVRGIGEGTVGLERFKFWVRQDYVFLIEYARLLALAAARSPDLQTEMSLHRSYAAEFGISHEELEGEPATPTTKAYTDFLLRVAATADFAELVAALLPCMWSFSEIGQRLARQARPADERYAKWIDLYASGEFAALAQWCRDLLDRLAEGLPERELWKLEAAFLSS